MNKCALRPIVHASLSGAECIRTQTHKGTSKEDTAYSAYPILHNQIIPICAPASCSKETKSLTSASDLKALRSSHHTETKQLAHITHRAPAPGGNSHLHNIWKGLGSGHGETPMRFQGPLQGSQVSLGQALRVCF